jgi:hypothetical protein
MKLHFTSQEKLMTKIVAFRYLRILMMWGNVNMMTWNWTCGADYSVQEWSDHSSFIKKQWQALCIATCWRAMLWHRYLMDMCSSKMGYHHISGHLSLNLSMSNSQEWIGQGGSILWPPPIAWFGPHWLFSVGIHQRHCVSEQSQWCAWCVP